MKPEPSPRMLNRRSLLIGAGGLATFAIARVGVAQDAQGTPGDPGAQATATRAAEQTEIAMLRTQVAEIPTCELPTATAEPTATATVVPAVAAGVPAALVETFMVTVQGIAPAVTPDGTIVQGALLQISFSAENTSTSAAKLPFLKFALTSDAGTVSQFDTKLNTAVVGSDIALAIRPGIIANLSMVFDFPDRAATSFILINTDDPTFRVALKLAERG
ncbi:MAG TPA: hypothetical protein PK691_05295 [Thermomicrobiales bacterium]|nr:hypothetical protein [Thermomicrobiales bacterium]HRA48312.1 hypothetical protein [Thermomicrobiales bacterium]